MQWINILRFTKPNRPLLGGALQPYVNLATKKRAQPPVASSGTREPATASRGGRDEQLPAAVTGEISSPYKARKQAA